MPDRALLAPTLKAHVPEDGLKPEATAMGWRDWLRRKPRRIQIAGALWDRLARDRIVFIQTPIDDIVANLVIAEMLFLKAEDPKASMSLYVNSPGGSVAAGLAIVDTMDIVPMPIETYCVGKADAMAAVIVAHGAHGKRYCLPHGRFSLSRTWSSKSEPAAMQECRAMDDALVHILARDTGIEPERLRADMERELHLDAQAAISYGLVDELAATKDSP